MSLVKSPRMTEKKLAANRRNRKLAHGPATAKGRERIRAAHLRHGFYAQAEEVALRALGEDPAQFQELLGRLWEKWNPTDALQEKLVARLARAVWRLDRSDRMQEGYALRQAKDVSIGREDRLHAQMMRLKMTSASLQSLAQSVAREHYVTTPADLELMQNLHQEGVVKEMGEIALALFYQLQEPGAPGEQDEGGGRSDPEANVRKVVARIQEIFGVRTSGPEPEADVAPASPGPFPDRQDGAGSRPQGSQQDAGATEAEEEGPTSGISSAEWEAREPVRQLLEHILSRQVEICEAQRKGTLRESLTGPSPYERAAEIAPTHRNATLMRRMEDSNFRQVARVTSLLMKMKRQERQIEALENSAVLHDVPETKGVSPHFSRKN
ncbi:MAG: hypothetical protein ABSA41_04325 [Terriglobia bacterium]|jgi:hypothetical protein